MTITQFHLRETPRRSKTKETANRLVAAKGRRYLGKRRKDDFVMGTRFLCGVVRTSGNHIVVTLAHGDTVKTTELHTLNGHDGEFYVICLMSIKK